MKQRRAWALSVVLGIVAAASAAVWPGAAEPPWGDGAMARAQDPEGTRLPGLAHAPLRVAAAPPAYALDAAIKYSVGNAARVMAAGDVTGDGLDDVVVLADQPPDGVRLVVFGQLPGGGLTLDASHFLAKATFSTGGIKLGDMNNDGRQDIVVVHSEGMNIFTVQPDGALSRQNYIRGFGRQLALLDIDSDGRLDVVAQSKDLSTLVACYGDGKGGILRSVAIPGSTSLLDLEAGDVTGDGLPDLVMADLAGFAVMPLGATGFGSRRLHVSSTGPATESVAIGDFDGDGRNDVAVSETTPDQLLLYHQNGQGGFRTATTLPAYSSSTDMIARDLDRDGRSDIVTAHMGQNVRTLRLQGEQGLGPLNVVRSTTNSWNSNRMAAADLNGDGCADLAGIENWTLEVHYGRNCHAVLSRLAHNDVDGDGRSDLLWRSAAKTDLAFWLMEGAVRRYGEGHYVGGGWDVIARGDFNGDGALDLVWSNGQDMQLWQRYGDSYQGLVMPLFPKGYRVVATGDVDGDGKADLLWRDEAATQLALWVMEGAAVRDSRAYGLSAAWTIAAAGDLDGDRRLDLVLTNDVRMDLWRGGRNLLWESATMGSYPVGWKLEQAADIDGDGRDDLLWRYAALGYFVYWRMVGPQRVNGLEFRVDGAWQVLEAGDYNGDGKADIVWTDGASMQVWQSDGTGEFAGLAMPDYPRGWTIE